MNQIMMLVPVIMNGKKIEKLCEALKVFKGTTNIILESEYPSSNMYLTEVERIKVSLDKQNT